MTLNNKGFAISAILYALLISFLLFLLVALNMFSASTNILNASNDDIVNGKSLYANQVIPAGACEQPTNNSWFETGKNTVVKVYSRYGVKYFPRDFSTGSTANGKLRAYISTEQITFNLSSENKAAKPLTLNNDYTPSSPYSYSLWSGTDLSGKTNSGSSVYFLAFYDTATDETYYLGLFDICG